MPVVDEMAVRFVLFGSEKISGSVDHYICSRATIKKIVFSTIEPAICGRENDRFKCPAGLSHSYRCGGHE
jgi:hypothetical protein